MPDPSPNRGVMIVLAYLWPLALIPLLLEKSDAEVQWHARHGVVLMVAELILWLACLVLMGIVSVISLVVAWVLSVFLGLFVWVAILAVHVTGIIKGINGGRMIVPGVSDYADRF
jgi:uncharacterized membrane protein